MKKIFSSSFFKNISMVFSSNIILLISGMLTSFLIPLISSVEDYGYWQIFSYYSGFLGMFMLGFNDGMNLRYAGNKLEELDSNLFKFFFRIVLILSLFWSLLTFIFINSMSFSEERLFIFTVLSFSIIIFNIHGFTAHLNQMTLRFKQYSISNMLERVLLVTSFPLIYLLTERKFYVFILVDLICKIIAMIYGLWTVRSLFLKKESKKDSDYNRNFLKSEVLENFKSGFPLMAGTILSSLVTTTPRIVVENFYSITEYGVFSLGYSTLNIAIQVIVASSAVFYPTLRKMDNDKHGTIYQSMKFIVLLVGLFSLLLYYIIYILIQLIFKDYVGVLEYLYLLFPIIIFQSFNSLVVSNFARLLRAEKQFFLNNLIFFIINLLTTSLLAIQVKSIPFMLLWSLLIMCLWVVVADKRLSSKLNIENKDMKVYISYIILFLLLNEFFPIFLSFIIYGLFLTVLLIWKKDSIKNMVLSISRNEDSFN